MPPSLYISYLSYLISPFLHAFQKSSFCSWHNLHTILHLMGGRHETTTSLENYLFSFQKCMIALEPQWSVNSLALGRSDSFKTVLTMSVRFKGTAVTLTKVNVQLTFMTTQSHLWVVQDLQYVNTFLLNSIRQGDQDLQPGGARHRDDTNLLMFSVKLLLVINDFKYPLLNEWHWAWWPVRCHKMYYGI